MSRAVRSIGITDAMEGDRDMGATRQVWRDGTMERREIRVGDRVMVIAYGLGAIREDVRAEGRVIGFGRTRVKVHLNGYDVMRDHAIDPDCLKVIGGA